MRFSISLFFLLLMMSCTFSSDQRLSNQRSAFTEVDESGNCFEKCIGTQAVMMDPGVLLPIYTGSDPSAFTFLTRTIKIDGGQEKWEKKLDTNCRSSDPDDCLIWCLVKQPPEYQEVTYLADTTQTSDFELQKFGVLFENKPKFKSIEALCRNEVYDIIELLQLALIENGASSLTVTETFDAATKAALVKFQKTNKLCVGPVSFETLDALGL